MRHAQVAIASVAIFLLAASPVPAQDQCSNLLQHGIYDHYRELGESSSLSEIRREFCSAYQKYKEDRKQGRVVTCPRLLVHLPC